MSGNLPAGVPEDDSTVLRPASDPRAIGGDNQGAYCPVVARRKGWKRQRLVISSGILNIMDVTFEKSPGWDLSVNAPRWDST